MHLWLLLSCHITICHWNAFHWRLTVMWQCLLRNFCHEAKGRLAGAAGVSDSDTLVLLHYDTSSKCLYTLDTSNKCCTHLFVCYSIQGRQGEARAEMCQPAGVPRAQPQGALQSQRADSDSWNRALQSQRACWHSWTGRDEMLLWQVFLIAGTPDFVLDSKGFEGVWSK